jgi:hypothetical protein
VQGDDIVVTLSGTSYVVTYYRAAAFPKCKNHQCPHVVSFRYSAVIAALVEGGM